MAIFCERCGKMRDSGSKFCDACGAPLNLGISAEEKKDDAPTIPNGPCAAIDACWAKFCSFRGRAGYSEFFWFQTVYSFFFAAACLTVAGEVYYEELFRNVGELWNDAPQFYDFVASCLRSGFAALLAYYLAWIVAAVVGFFPALAVAARRLHDSNRSAACLFWYLFFPLILFFVLLAATPLFPNEHEFTLLVAMLIALGWGLSGQVILFVLCVLPPSRGENKYGPEPVEARKRR